jgi:hypothetical protein
MQSTRLHNLSLQPHNSDTATIHRKQLPFKNGSSRGSRWLLAEKSARLVSRKCVTNFYLNNLLTDIRAQNHTFATLIVGENEARFNVHESLLVTYSEFFRAALQGGFKEAHEKTVELEDEDSDIIELFVHWLYYQRFPDKNKGDDDDLLAKWTLNENEDYQKIDKLTQLYVFGDKYQVSKLQRDVIDEVFDIYVHQRNDIPLPGNKQLAFIFDLLRVQDPFCQLITDVICWMGNADLYDSIEEGDGLEAFAIASLRRFSQIHKANNLGKRVGVSNLKYNLNLCDYHQHESKEEKAACKKEREEK